MLMTYQFLYFEYVLNAVEDELTQALGGRCRIIMKRGLDPESARNIRLIESMAFRSELRYSRDEMSVRAFEKGFTLLEVWLEDKQVAFLFGYRDPSEDSAFYLDTVATLIEGKGVGSSLIALALLHSLEAGYRHVTLRTEERDEKGRMLRRFYERLGFQVFPCNPAEGIGMRMEVDLMDIEVILGRVLRPWMERNEKPTIPSIISPPIRASQ